MRCPTSVSATRKSLSVTDFGIRNENATAQPAAATEVRLEEMLSGEGDERLAHHLASCPARSHCDLSDAIYDFRIHPR